jgi:NAD+ kinase
MRNFLIITNKYRDDDLSVTKRVYQHLKKNQAVCRALTDLGSEYEEIPDLDPETECIIVIGGDGTMLQAARAVAGKNIPLIGVNKGTLGFLTEIELPNLEQMLDRLLVDDYMVEERMMLLGELHHRGKMVYESLALNDLVISRSGYSRIIECKIWVNGKIMDNYHGDGLIISTPTGSTGYSLSAGGPVVCPKASIMLVTPICPHAMGVRSTVLVPSDDIWVEIGRLRKTQEEEAIATFDGQMGIRLKPGDRLHIGSAAEKTHLLRMKERNFYDVLRNKMKSGQEV